MALTIRDALMIVLGMGLGATCLGFGLWLGGYWRRGN